MLDWISGEFNLFLFQFTKREASNRKVIFQMTFAGADENSTAVIYNCKKDCFLFCS